jgi:hypothetical protein
MWAQLDLEERCKRPKKKKNNLILINFGAKKFENPKTKNLDV